MSDEMGEGITLSRLRRVGGAVVGLAAVSVLASTGAAAGTATATGAKSTAATTTAAAATNNAKGISAVGVLRTHTNEPSQQTEMIPVSPAASGNVLALAIETKFPTNQSFTAASVTGGGVTTWRRARSFLSASGIHGLEVWSGAVTTPGSSTVTVNYTAKAAMRSPGSASSLDIHEFSSSEGTASQWSVDMTGQLDTQTASSTPSYPTLTPSAAPEAYYGYIAVPGSLNPGTTPGVVYQSDARGNQTAYDVNVSMTITPQGNAPSMTMEKSESIALLLRAMHRSGVVAPATLRSGEFLESGDGRHIAVQQSDGNFVVYSSGRPTYATGTFTGRLVPGSFLAVQNDGNLVQYGPTGRAQFASNTAGTGPGHLLVMQDDGNLVLYGARGPLFATNTVGR